MSDFIEPLLQESDDRYIIYPIKFPDIDNYYQTHQALKWELADIDMVSDLPDWVKLDEKAQRLIKYILAFFAAADSIVMKNISANFASEVQYPEAISFYAVQNFMEEIHSRTYGRLIETYISEHTERVQLFNAIRGMPAIKAKAKWAEKWISSNEPFSKRLLAFAIVEGLFFSSAFATIYYIDSLHKMRGLCISNDYIARDENLHVEFAAHLYTRHIVNKLSQEEVEELIYDAVEIEKLFVAESMPDPLTGMNIKLMSQYVEFVADKLMNQFGYTSKYSHVKCPFPFMDKIALQNQTSFFDQRPTEYKRNTTTTKEKKELNFGIDF